jgi:hypothetical protein
MYWKIGNTRANNIDNLGGLSRIDIPTAATSEPYPNGPDQKTWKGAWHSITEPALIACHICAEACVTPFGSGNLAHLIGSRTDTPTAESLLMGNAPDMASCILPEYAEEPI